MQRVPVWLALLALSLRLALPALHHHGEHALHAHASVCHAEILHGTCLHGAAAPGSTTNAPAADAEGDHDACLACELELSSPGAPVPVPLVFAQPLRKQALQQAPPRRLLVAHRIEPQSARAPPGMTGLRC
jgi:hypothetical protein